MSLIIFSKQTSNRLEYVLNLIFHELLGLDYQLVTTKKTFTESSLYKVNYSREELTSDLQILPEALLFEKNIDEKYPSLGLVRQTKVLFHNPRCSFGYDIFSACFYLVSRYEEYFPKTYDHHGRFSSSDSILTAHKILDKPVVNLWVQDLIREINKEEENISFQPKSFNFLSTIDIDQAYQYRHKEFFRTHLGYAKDLLGGEIEKVKKRWQVRKRRLRDPFDSYEFQFSQHQKYGNESLYFIQTGSLGKFDKNLSIKNKFFQKLIKKIGNQTNTSVGIHPSYNSFHQLEKLLEEKDNLEKLMGRTIDQSRQHYLRFQLPRTYQILLDLGIRKEYSMGYSDQIGFRAGIAAPFFWFDLKKNERTKLKVFPFCFMDITPQFYYQMNPEEAIAVHRTLMQEIKNVGGFYSSLWHNESLGNENQWKGWQQVYQNILADTTKEW